MQDVQPLSKGKQTFAPPQRLSADDAEARRRAAEEFQSEEDASNFLTLGEVKARDPLEVLEWRQDGIQLAVFDKLRKGGYDIARELDLHQRTVKEARSDVYQLINQAHTNNWRCVLISHGKGLRSATPAKLKSYVAHWLARSDQKICGQSRGKPRAVRAKKRSHGRDRLIAAIGLKGC